MTATLDHFIIQTDVEAVERFVDAVGMLTRGKWEKVATDSAAEVAARSAANAVLEAVITHNRLGVQAWDIMDDVETSIFCSLGPEGFTQSGPEGQSLRRARQAAKTAALALFVRPLLTSVDFDALYRPFVSLVPRSA